VTVIAFSIFIASRIDHVDAALFTTRLAFDA
jgi:hypothetical protein